MSCVACTNPDKPVANAIIKYRPKLLYQMIKTHRFGGVLKGVSFPTK